MFLVAVAAVLVPGLVMALTRVVATVNAAVVMVAVFSIHVVAVELDAAGPGADIQAVVLPPLVLLVVPIQAYPALVGGDPDVVIVFGRGGAAKAIP